MAKKIGAIELHAQTDFYIECIENMSPQYQVQTVANSMAEVSNEYCPIDLSKLPAYLPAEEPSNVELYKVYKKVQSQKKTKSTLDIDIPASLGK